MPFTGMAEHVIKNAEGTPAKEPFKHICGSDHKKRGKN